MNQDIIAAAFCLLTPPLSYYSVLFGRWLGDRFNDWLEQND